MIELRMASAGDIPVLQAIWKTVFGDSDEFLSLFFHTLFPCSAALIAHVDGAPAGSAYVLDIARLREPDGGETPCPYVYAVGVLPEYRGLDIGKLLGLRCRDHCREKGSLSCIVPAERGLFDFYRRFADYVPAFSVTERAVSAGPDAEYALSPLSAADYAPLREALLAGQPHLCFREEALSFLERLCKLNGGGLFRLSRPDAYAVAVCEGGALLSVKELLCSKPEDAADFAAALAALLGFDACTFRTPEDKKHPESTRAFGMLSEFRSAGPIWFGPAFD